LKEHLLRRVLLLLAQETNNVPLEDLAAGGVDPDWNNVLFKQDRMYTHKIMHIHYTTYDVRRGEDIVHIGSSQRNIMVLNPQFSVENIDSQHPFWYARVIGIYHANVMYIGRGNADYHPRRLDFLWVRWYHFKDAPCGWKQLKLDKLRFPPLGEPELFGFLDPNDVLRSAHIIPLLSGGKVTTDGISTSPCAQNGDDWKAYAVNRYVLKFVI
jgi:hypothetical protein